MERTVGWTSSIERFIAQLGLDFCIGAAETSRNRTCRVGKRAFLYFCTICWRQIKEEHDS